MTTIICHGYKNSDDEYVACGKVMGEKEGDGVEEGYCDECFRKEIDECFEHMNDIKSQLENGTYDFGSSATVKVGRIHAIELARAHYYD